MHRPVNNKREYLSVVASAEKIHSKAIEIMLEFLRIQNKNFQMKMFPTSITYRHL